MTPESGAPQVLLYTQTMDHRMTFSFPQWPFISGNLSLQVKRGDSFQKNSAVDVLVHACNPRVWEAETGGTL